MIRWRRAVANVNRRFRANRYYSSSFQPKVNSSLAQQEIQDLHTLLEQSMEQNDFNSANNYIQQINSNLEKYRKSLRSQQILFFQLDMLRYQTVMSMQLQNYEQVLKYTSQILEKQELAEDLSLFHSLLPIFIYAMKMRCEALNATSRFNETLDYIEQICETLSEKLANEYLEEAEQLLLTTAISDFKLSKANMYFFILNRGSEALELLNEIIGHGDANPRTYLLRGLVSIEMPDPEDRLEQIISDANNAKLLDTEGAISINAQMILAQCLVLKKSYSEALALCNIVLQSHPDNIACLIYRAESYLNLFDYTRALNDCRTIEQYTDTQNLTVFNIKYRCLFHLAKYDELVLECKQQMESHNYETLKSMHRMAQVAQIIWEQGSYSAALELLEDMKDQHLNEYLSLLIDNNRVDQAVHLANRLVENFKDGNRTDLLKSVLNQALAYATSGSLEEAHSALDNATAFSDNKYHLLLINYYRARIAALQPSTKYESIGLYLESLNAATQLHQLCLIPEILIHLAKVEAECGLASDSAQHLERAKSIAPNHAAFTHAGIHL